VECGLSFPKIMLDTGDGYENITYDFRISAPKYFQASILSQWGEIQKLYETFHNSLAVDDNLQEYFAEIDSVKEIYTDEFHLAGSVLDVGGHQGRLRYWLDSNVTYYVSVDPLDIAFNNISQQRNLLQAYPQIKEPCNFLLAHAERLPFKSNSFDWVHMRSTVDHFYDPYAAFLEAFRCSKEDGQLLIGLSIMEKYYEEMHRRTILSEQGKDNVNSCKSKIKHFLGKNNVERIKKILAGFRGLKDQPEPNKHDDHMYRFTRDNLVELCGKTGWMMSKEHWQKEPFFYCLYASFVAQK
jgi:ubiquinone/menaquinone biosynthesis C-methylase UbiE